MGEAAHGDRDRLCTRKFNLLVPLWLCIPTRVGPADAVHPRSRMARLGTEDRDVSFPRTTEHDTRPDEPLRVFGPVPENW